MQMIEVSKLKPHPRNHEFFDDITGDKWKDFLESIIRRGIVEAVVATEDPLTHELITVSGHQRVRGCKEIKILEIPCRIVHYPEFDEKTGTPREDMILEDLICTNIMQRGIGNVNPMKMAKCIRELERIYGIKQGRGGNTTYPNNSDSKTQQDLAKQLDISQDIITNYKKLTELIPELQSLVETGALKATTAYKIYAKLPQEEQEELFNKIGKEKIKQLTQKQTEEEINKINKEKEELQNTNKHLEQSFNELSKKYNEQQKLQEEINKLKKELEQKPKEIVKEIRVEVTPDDYGDLQKKIEDSQKYYNNLKKDYDVKIKKLQELEQQIKSMTELEPDEQYNKKLKEDAILFCAKIENFISQVGGLAYLSNHIKDLPQNEKQTYIKCVELIESWAYNVKVNMKEFI